MIAPAAKVFGDVHIVDARDRNPADGFYAYRQSGDSAEYLQRDGTWKRDCTHGWFASAEAIQQLLNSRHMAPMPPSPATLRDGVVIVTDHETEVD